MATQSTSGQHAPAGTPPARALRRSRTRINATPAQGEAERGAGSPLACPVIEKAARHGAHRHRGVRSRNRLNSENGKTAG